MYTTESLQLDRSNGHSVEIGVDPEIVLPRGNYGIFSDTHFGSTRFDPKAFDSFLSHCVARDVSTLLCAGDLIDYHVLQRDFQGDKRLYTQAVAKGFDLLAARGMHAFCVPGNHEISLNTDQPGIMDNLLRSHGSVWTLLDSTSSKVSVGDIPIRINHFATQGSDGVLTVGGHDHKPGISRLFINPGGFQRHPETHLRTGGYVLTSQNTIERVGEPTEGDQLLIDSLISAGFVPKRIDIHQNCESATYMPPLLGMVRNIDPNAVVWITGSTPMGSKNRSIGYMHPRYNVQYLPDGTIHVADGKPRSPMKCAVSDIDIEIISSKVCPPDLDQIIKLLRHQGKVPSLQRLEICCYGPGQLEQDMSLNVDKPGGHNYAMYRTLLAPRATVQDDTISSLYLDSLAGVALNRLSLHIPDQNDLMTDPTIRVAGGYGDFKGRVKHPVRAGETVDLKLSPTSGTIYDYLLAKQAPSLAFPPYQRGVEGSFKVVFPKESEILVHNPVDYGNQIIAPPLMAYDSNVHFGQLLDLFAADMYARFHSTEFNPFCFQVTGPYWDKRDEEPVQIRDLVENNVRHITCRLRRYDMKGAIHRDDSPETGARLDDMFRRLDSLGLIYYDKNGPVLRMGDALTMLGSIRRSTNPRVIQAAAQYRQEGKVLPMYPRSMDDGEGYLGKYYQRAAGHDLYPTFSLLGNISPTHLTNTVFAGANVATQFVLGLNVGLKAISPEAETDAVIHSLVTSPQGMRMSRKSTSYPIPTLEYLEAEITRITSDDKFSSDHGEALPAVLKLGILSHYRVEKETKYDPLVYERAIKCIRILRRMCVPTPQAKNTLDRSIVDMSLVPEWIKNRIQGCDIGAATIQFMQQVERLNPKDTRPQSKNQLVGLISTGWVLAGDSFLKALSI
jgi:hypothetical protein